MRRVVFVNRYFWPDHSATSQMVSDLAFHLASRGWDVCAITSRQRYEDSHAALDAESSERGVRIVRVWSTRFGRAGLLGRALDYLTFYLSAFFAIRELGHDAVVVPMTDPPLLSVIGALGSRRVVNWLQDLFPEVAEGLGIRVPGLVRRIRDWSLRRARANVVIGERMGERVPNAVVIHNWAAPGLGPVPRDANPLRDAWNLGSSFVAGYSGNLGRAHEFDTIARAMKLLPEVRFLIIGSGAQLEAVRREAGDNALFLPYQPRERLSESLSAADAHLVSLQPQLEGLIVPSKFYGVLAVGRPVVFIGARDGELARIIEAHRCGIVVAQGDGDALANALRTLATHSEESDAMGRRGLDAYRTHFAPDRAFQQWEDVLSRA